MVAAEPRGCTAPDSQIGEDVGKESAASCFQHEQHAFAVYHHGGQWPGQGGRGLLRRAVLQVEPLPERGRAPPQDGDKGSKCQWEDGGGGSLVCRRGDFWCR